MQKIVAGMLALLMLAGCSSIPFLSGEFRMSAAELTQKMERRFPLERNIGGLLEVTLLRPKVELNEAENRLATSFDVSIKLPLSNRRLAGEVKISGRPEYVSESRALFLREARVERIRMDNAPEALSASVAKNASLLAREFLEDKPLYTFKPEDFTRAGVRFEPERVVVQSDAIVLKVK